MIQRLLRIIFWISILLPCFWLLVAILKTVIPLEFANNDYESIYDQTWFFGFPIAILLTLTGTINRKESAGIVAVKIFVTICCSGVSVFVMMILLFGAGMCDWTTGKVFFENKENSSTKIVQRSFGCGATDSSPANLRVAKITQITPYLIWVTDVDTTQINKEEWIRMDLSGN